MYKSSTCEDVRDIYPSYIVVQILFYIYVCVHDVYLLQTIPYLQSRIDTARTSIPQFICSMASHRAVLIHCSQHEADVGGQKVIHLITL